MPYSKFAMHCPNCPDVIAEPTTTIRQADGSIKAYYRHGDHTWNQRFTVSHEVPEITPEEQHQERDYQPPETEVMEWDEDTREQFIKHNGRDAYGKLVALHVKNGQAHVEQPTPAMPQTDDPREWTPTQATNYCEKYGREKYAERLSDAYAKDKGFEEA